MLFVAGIGIPATLHQIGIGNSDSRYRQRISSKNFRQAILETSTCHFREGRNPQTGKSWIPAFAEPALMKMGEWQLW